ncbi:2-oxo acid dehydrogenase subunit E2 [Halomonas sp. MCCC 1A17488]|uniref:dihydrolipoamide acetyltransferase family protein n=1 Tax=unclassified Halomonas TaxID=2609666 RepID=UPI0018D1F6EF|nr:dihydrolipoamide acetyltransferase family protein [Halomonas sp. SS10-MC5]MCE8015522.1 2-oxo acid dehydrogenase subunit E2 [Halomonas sp. MCCC 1A17488]MCG3238855.1 2-oxo acid dehydrogenase subunit E2 [Halomonas sp. MCCC 1A17488]QPP51184.1 2-oxo acid dehydrogenase subunit E2 [Halomonas sp. SS10-MC5]
MSDFLMPSMGADMEAGTLVEWLVSPGDRVEKGQVIAVVETAKGAIDVEVFESGVVEECYVEPDTRVPVGTPLARIGSSERVVAGRPGSLLEPAVLAETVSAEATSAGPVAEPSQFRESPPAPSPQPETDRVAASPAARRRARELGLELGNINGSGPGGAVVLRDLAQAADDKPRHEHRRSGAFDRDEMRQAIAASMSRSKREIPHYYLATTLDLHAAEHWLAEYNREQPPEARLLLAALFMKATARALSRYPDLNGHYDEQGFHPAERVHLGMAIHLRGGGLIAPALRDAEAQDLPALMSRLQDLVQRARSGGLRASELSSATATVTALGERGVDTVYGVIHPPQVAMVGFGSVRRRPLAVGDMLAIRPAVDVSLAADHRVCDGHLGARFLNEIDAQLQHPEAL